MQIFDIPTYQKQEKARRHSRILFNALQWKQFMLAFALILFIGDRKIFGRWNAFY